MSDAYNDDGLWIITSLLVWFALTAVFICWITGRWQ